MSVKTVATTIQERVATPYKSHTGAYKFNICCDGLDFVATRFPLLYGIQEHSIGFSREKIRIDRLEIKILLKIRHIQERKSVRALFTTHLSQQNSSFFKFCALF